MSDKKQELTLSQRIETFERDVREKSYDKAINELRAIFPILESSKEGFGKTLSQVTPFSEKEATILAAAITNLLVDSEFVLKRNSLMVFAQHKRVLSQTFEVSGYRGTGHFIRLFGKTDEQGNTTFKGADVPKMLCGLSLNAMPEQMFDVIMRQRPDVSWPLVNGWLSEQLLYSPAAEKMRSKLLASGKHWENIPVTFDAIRNLGPAYMGCSYADAPHKHDIKVAMNSLVRRWLLENDITDAVLDVPRRAVKRRPTLIIVAELYHGVHAMHRCYGPAIRALKDHFKLIYMSPDGKCDPKIEYMFDKIDSTKFSNAAPKAFFDKVKSYRPDVIYYPSVGMRLMSIMGSNLRLAPIQLMTYGHPATTNSEFIDYSLLMEGQIGNEATIHNKILYWPSGPRYERRSDLERHSVNIRKEPETIRIAVPAWSRKVTPLFLQACQHIQKHAKKKVEFLFFPNGAGSLFQGFQRRVSSMANAQVYPRTNYNEYIKRLNTADIFLSTFPFGATNGILDAGPLGLPIVNLKGDEVHALNDSEMVSHMKQPEWLSANSVDEFIKAVLRLIENDDERVEISKANASYDYQNGMMVSPKSNCEPFGHMVDVAYRYHETIQSLPKKGFPFKDLMALHEEK